MRIETFALLGQFIFITTAVLQSVFLYCLRRHEPQIWSQLGEPDIFNIKGGLKPLWYAISGKYTGKESPAFVHACRALRYSFFCLIGYVILFLSHVFSGWAAYSTAA